MMKEIDTDTLAQFLQQWKKGKKPEELRTLRKALRIDKRAMSFRLTETEIELAKWLAAVLYEAQIIPKSTFSEVMRYAFYSLIHTLSRRGILQAALREIAAERSLQEYEVPQIEQPSNQISDESEQSFERHEELHDASSRTHEHNNQAAYSQKHSEQYPHSRTQSNQEEHAPQTS